MKEFLEGAIAIAKTVKLCKPGVISAYPITPQTHIVEHLAKLVAESELKAEFVNVESEHSAASVVLGATATGVRAYSSSSSQGLILMAEVLFNIAGLRLPLVLCCVNRALSAPINIWNDHQDSISIRDSGWIQMYAETIQEACDMHIQAYKISENPKVLLPVMVCIDGYLLSHGYEIVDIPEQEQVDKFLPEYKLPYKLDVEKPLTLGVLSDPNYYTETRYAIHESMVKEAIPVIKQTSDEFSKVFKKNSYGLIEKYFVDDAQKIIIAMGSICGIIKDVVDELRSKGEKVGLLRIITYRPFPEKEILDAIENVKEIGIIDKSISLGAYGPVFTDVRAICQMKDKKISGFIAGLGGRDIKKLDIYEIFDKISKQQKNLEFINVDLNKIEVNI